MTYIITIYIVLLLLILFPLVLYAKLTKNEKLYHTLLVFFSKRSYKVNGSSVEVVGSENILEVPHVLIANHSGFYDVPTIYASTKVPTSFMGKKSLGKIPLFNFYFKANHMVFVDREDPRQAIKSLSIAADLVKNGKSIIVFPEGTRNKEIEQFKPGAFKIATKSKAPISPVTVLGTYDMLEKHGKIKKNKVTIIFHKSIPYEEYKDLSTPELIEKVQKTISDSYYQK